MAKMAKIIQKTCQVLRRRVRFTDAGLRLPESEFPQNDTDKIREATKLYVETWIVPLLNAIERGDTRSLHLSCRYEHGTEMEEIEEGRKQ